MTHTLLSVILISEICQLSVQFLDSSLSALYYLKWPISFLFTSLHRALCSFQIVNVWTEMTMTTSRARGVVNYNFFDESVLQTEARCKKLQQCSLNLFLQFCRAQRRG